MSGGGARGAYEAGVDPLANFSSISAGFPFSITLLSILLVHEMGHYTMSRVHGVKATLPYFIPGLPFMIGTFGAFIRMKSPPSTRRALFDVGAAGPWAGLLIAIPAVIIGLRMSEVQPAGRARQSGRDFANGKRLTPGERLGPSA